jgi:hypothetical protein
VASRLYRTTRPLYLQVICALDQLGIATVGTATTLALVALYVTGLVLLDARPTQTRVTRTLPGRCHDALNRLLRTMPWSTRSLMAGLIGWVTRSGMTGYLCLDDVVVEKAFAKRLPWAGPTGSPTSARSPACTSWSCCVQHRRGLQDPGRLAPVAAQTILRAAPLPDQTGAGRADAH